MHQNAAGEYDGESICLKPCFSMAAILNERHRRELIVDQQLNNHLK